MTVNLKLHERPEGSHLCPSYIMYTEVKEVARKREKNIGYRVTHRTPSLISTRSL